MLNIGSEQIRGGARRRRTQVHPERPLDAQHRFQTNTRRCKQAAMLAHAASGRPMATASPLPPACRGRASHETMRRASPGRP